MLPQIGFPELIILAVLALIVVGPEDLPKLMRGLGRFMSKVRGMAQEFKDAFNEMGAASEMAELKREIEELKEMGKLANLTDGNLKEDMRKIDDEIRDATSLDNPKTSSKAETDTDPVEGRDQ